MKFLLLTIALVTPSFAWAQPLVRAPQNAVAINVTDYGARCDGLADDTLALQRAIIAADTTPFVSLLLPPSTCRFTETLVFGGRTDRYSEVSLIGHGEYTSHLSYTGPMNRPAMLISHMSAFRWQGFSLSSPTVTNVGSRGTAVGILLDGPFGSGGTMNTTITFDHVLVSGFHIGMLAGGGDSASEIECRMCTFQWNDVGWSANGYNSLNFWFYGVGIPHNLVGMKLGGPWVTDAPHVIGGSSAGNVVADFELGNSFGELSIANFRAEVSVGARFLTGPAPGGYAPMVSIRDSSIVGRAGETVMDVASLHLETSTVIGTIKALNDSCAPTAGHHVLTIEDSAVSEDPVGWPMVFGAGGLFKFRFVGNRSANFGNPGWLEDRAGTWSCGVVAP